MKADSDSIAVISVLGLIGLASVFQQIPDGNAQLVATISAGLVGYLAKSMHIPTPPAPPPTPLPPDDFTIPTPPGANP